MSRRKKTTEKQVITTDAFSNPMFRLGFGTQAPLEATEYPLTRLTDNYAQLNSMYRTGSILQSVVDIVPADMLREWFTVTGDIKPEDLDTLQKTLRITKLRSSLDEGLRWGRLYGGAAGIILLKGQENRLDKPLNLKTILPGSFAGLLILDRWSGVSPSLNIVTDISDPDFGLPEYYDINSGENGKIVARVHHSRVIRFTGRELPYLEKLAESYWGESEIEPIFTEIRLYDNVMANLGNLTFRANIDTMAIKNLEQLFAIGSTEQQQRFWNMMQAQSVAKSNFGIQLIDQDTQTSNTQYTFTGWNYVIEAIQVNLAAATHIPITKLFGRSPAGLNATGDSDMRNYYNYVDGLRERVLRPILERLIPVFAMSTWGDIPEDIDIQFPPLETPDPNELATIAKTKAETVVLAFQNSMLDLGQAQQELKKLADNTGMFDTIEDEDISGNKGKTYQDVTALQDPMAGITEGAEEDNPFPVNDYRPDQRRDENGRFTNEGRALREIEDEIRNSALETAAGLDAEGNKVFQISSGEVSEVSIPSEELEKLRDGVFTHNHPGGTTFTSDDVDKALRYGFKELRACHSGGAYILRREEKTEISDNFAVDLYTFETAARKMYTEKYHAGVYSKEEAGRRFNETRKMWVTRNAKSYGYQYIEETI